MFLHLWIIGFLTNLCILNPCMQRKKISLSVADPWLTCWSKKEAQHLAGFESMISWLRGRFFTSVLQSLTFRNKLLCLWKVLLLDVKSEFVWLQNFRLSSCWCRVICLTWNIIMIIISFEIVSFAGFKPFGKLGCLCLSKTSFRLTSDRF